jgi:HK97 family phage portal protein
MARVIDMSHSITAAVKDNYSNWKAFMGIPQEGGGVPRGLRAMGQVPADEAWVHSCVTKLSMAAQSVELRVQVREGKEWVDNADVSDGAADDLQLLLDDVNPEWDGNQLQMYIEASDDIHGGCYVRKVRGRFGGKPQELHWLPATNVEPIMGAKRVEKYEYRPDSSGVAELIEPKNIIPFRRFNLLDPNRIVSPWEAARYDITTLRRIAEWNANLLGNYGIPPGAWVADKDADLAPTELNAIKRALRAIRGSGGAGKIPVIPGGLTWVPLSLSQKDADWIGSGKVSRMAICAISGVPLIIAGDDDKNAAYASARDAERIMWRITLIPKLDARSARWDSWLVPEFDPTRKRLRIRYDYTKIEALMAPPAEEQQAWQGWVKLGMPMDRAIDKFHLGRKWEGSEESRVNGQTPEERAEEAERERESAIRPSNYQVSTGQGREAVRALGKGLYRHPAVRAWFDASDDSGLKSLMAESQVPIVIEGLRRRYSAEQIADGADGFKGLAPDPSVVVNVTTPDVHVTTPPMTIEPGAVQVSVTTPEQPAPIVNVTAPAVKVAAPQVRVEPLITVQPAAVNVPSVQDVRIVSEPRRVQSAERDGDGRITRTVETDG